MPVNPSTTETADLSGVFVKQAAALNAMESRAKARTDVATSLHGLARDLMTIVTSVGRLDDDGHVFVPGGEISTAFDNGLLELSQAALSSFLKAVGGFRDLLVNAQSDLNASQHPLTEYLRTTTDDDTQKKHEVLAYCKNAAERHGELVVKRDEISSNYRHSMRFAFSEIRQVATLLDNHPLIRQASIGPLGDEEFLPETSFVDQLKNILEKLKGLA